MKKITMSEQTTEKVHVRTGDYPKDYHCPDGPYSKPFLGELIKPDGSYYSRLERRQYYDKAVETAHVAKTPLHIARWAVQQFSKTNGWVLDPMMGAGTTAVESLRQGRNVAGMEIEFIDIIEANTSINNPHQKRCEIRHDDARNIGEFLNDLGVKFDLIVNNPPYSGDVNQHGFSERDDEGKFKDTAKRYDPKYNNLAFLNEGSEYWLTLKKIYDESIRFLKKDGKFVVGVKDMMRQKKPYLLHALMADLLKQNPSMKFVGQAVLRHHPATLFLNTYEKRYGIAPPYYQSIVVFSKEK